MFLVTDLFGFFHAPSYFTVVVCVEDSSIDEFPCFICFNMRIMSTLDLENGQGFNSMGKSLRKSHFYGLVNPVLVRLPNDLTTLPRPYLLSCTSTMHSALLLDASGSSELTLHCVSAWTLYIFFEIFTVLFLISYPFTNFFLPSFVAAVMREVSLTKRKRLLQQRKELSC